MPACRTVICGKVVIELHPEVLHRTNATQKAYSILFTSKNVIASYVINVRIGTIKFVRAFIMMIEDIALR